MNAPAERHMISVDAGAGRFNFRSAGIAQRDGHVLLQRMMTGAYWFLPGGRVELTEPSAITLARELEEELGVEAEVGRLCFVVEAFFKDEGRRIHELATYYAVVLPETFPFRTDGEVCFECEDGGQRMHFKWVPVSAAALAGADFQPAVLRDRLAQLPTGIEHIVAIED